VKLNAKTEQPTLMFDFVLSQVQAATILTSFC